MPAQLDALSSTERLELDLDMLAAEHKLVVVKELNVTGHSYKLLTPTDAYIYMLNQWQPHDQMH